MLQHTVKIEVKMEIGDKFNCSQCDFETEHEKFLKRHELSHQKNKYFKCHKCVFETLYKKMYLKHLQAHKFKKKEKPSEMNVREKIIISNIQCDECTFETSSQELLDIHKKLKHTDVEDPDNYINLHKCPYCKYQTNWEPCLKRHVEREHPDGKPVKVKKEKEPENKKKALKVDIKIKEV